MKQYTFEEVRGLTFAELGAIDDPMALMATGSLAPMLIRYIVRTVQLESRYRSSRAQAVERRGPPCADWRKFANCWAISADG
jgi:hypothetical protein